MACEGCVFSEVQAIKRYLDEDAEALKAFESHGIIPKRRKCERCESDLQIKSEERHFRCYKRLKKDPGIKRAVKCNFYASQYKSTWLAKAKLRPSTNILFLNAFLRRSFSQEFCVRNLRIPAPTVVSWKSFCLDVCLRWLENQEPIGGPGKVVEVYESKFGRKKYNCAEQEGVWIFGGIEQDSKRRFILPVESPDAATFIPLCKKYILPGSTVCSNSSEAFAALEAEGFTHHIIQQPSLPGEPESGADSPDNAKRFWKVWKDTKCWVIRAGIKKAQYRHYFARFLFVHDHPDHSTILHHFLVEIARQYPPPP